MNCTYCSETALFSYNEEFFCKRHLEAIVSKNSKIYYFLDVKKTKIEEKLNRKYNKLLKKCETFDDYQILAQEFKKDLSLIKSEKYKQ